MALGIARNEIDPSEWEFFVTWIELAFRGGKETPIQAVTGDLVFAAHRLTKWMSRYPKPGLQVLGKRVAESLPVWEAALSSKSPADNLPRPYSTSLTGFQKVVVLSILEPELLPSLARWLSRKLFRPVPAVGPIEKICNVASTMPPTVPLLMFVGSEIGSVPLVTAANTAFERRMAKHGDDPGSLLVDKEDGRVLSAFAKGRRARTPGRGVVVMCAGDNSALAMQAVVQDARKLGQWVVVVNADLEPGLMLALLQALADDPGHAMHPHFRLIVCLSEDADAGVRWALSSKVSLIGAGAEAPCRRMVR